MIKSNDDLKNIKRENKQSNETIRKVTRIVNEGKNCGNESKKELRSKLDKITKILNSHYDQVEFNENNPICLKRREL